MMKISTIGVALMVLTFPMNLVSCSTENELIVEETKTEDLSLKAFENFGRDLDQLSSHLAKSRSTILDSSVADNDSTLNSQGEVAIQTLLPLANAFFDELEISDQDFENAIVELREEGEDTANMRIDALKCYSALALYDTYLSDPSLRPQTRADYLEYAGCIALGMSIREAANWSTARIAKFLAKKAIGRAVPYIGWGWAVISAHECIKKL